MPQDIPTDTTPSTKHPLGRLVAAALLGLGLLAVLGFVAYQGARTRDGVAKSDVVVLSIDGMSCVGCAGAVENTIREVDGVAEVTVDYDLRSASVRLVDTSIAPATVVAAVENAGYKARIEEPGGRAGR